jgi:hypothetical protein
MIDRNDFIEEIKLRENIRKAINIVRSRKKTTINENLMQEVRLRDLIRDLISESNPVATTAKHNNTGINSLEDLLKNSNLLSVLETGYKSLTTDKQQRDSYRNHILAAVQQSLAPEEERKAAGGGLSARGGLSEEIDINITDDPTDDPDFIDVEDKEAPEPDAREDFALSGEDKTGRNRAFTDFQNIEKVILTAFDDLDNPEDLTLFEEYLIKNLSLYFDKFESELDVNVEAPSIADDAEANIEPSVDIEDDTGAAPIELEELLQHLDVNDIIENLL